MPNRSSPNIIWIFGDQHRAQALGYRGDPNVSTPVIDNLTRHGRSFDCAVAGAPWCAPFRGALLSGLYPHQSGVVKTPSPLDPALPTVAKPFKEAGYHTAYIGKWHLSGSNDNVFVPPTHRGGFDYWQGYENNNNQEFCSIHGSDGDTPQRLQGYETDALTDLFMSHISNHCHKPFFAVLSVQPPHNPYCPPRSSPYGPPKRAADIQLRRNVPPVAWVEERARQDAAGYYGMIENLDWNIGRIQTRLRELGIDDNTYLFFFSDHGDMLGSHAQWEKSAPWEESIRIPFIVSHAAGSAALPIGSCDAPINHVDIAPTTLGLCGIDVPSWMQGHDYSGNLRFAEDGWSAPDLSDSEPDSAYLQQIPRKFHPLCPNVSWRGVAMRDGWKYVCTPGQDWLLFNTREDPYELANFVHNAKFARQRQRCWDALQRWILKTNDNFVLPPRDPA
ncbi:MAG: sulfatase [Verrucomicrobia bacterium]|nr:sulfatase [Verrucomicrobiota bacterium]